MSTLSTLYWVLPLALVLSVWMTGRLRRYALARSIIDVPNARSSHTAPTPRGGGVAIVVTFLLLLPLLTAYGLVAGTTALAVGGAGLLIAVIGFLDDHGHVAARWRLLAHFSAAAWLLYWVGGMPPGVLPALVPGWLANVLAAFGLVWLLNLYNFMDGIDGIASVEALSACIGIAVLYGLLGAPELGAVPMLLAAAVCGFLAWNFPPARIFMGDAGSGFLGIVLGALVLQAGWLDPVAFWAWIILLGVFITDASWTLARRLLRREKVYEAHRSHAYQYASRQAGRHLPVTLAVAAINVFWLLPWALLVGTGGVHAGLGVVCAYAPLLVLAWRFRAGQREPAPA
ncbi:MAG: glycosyltransferase family 4 protein [Bordetella sp.]|nr:glycosyltransferase family 4 protein [Bordetella sp.]